MKTTIQVGDVVTIYEDPVTRRKPEGDATLRECYRHHGNSASFRVEFLDEPGEFYERMVAADEGQSIDAEETEQLYDT